MPRDSLRHSFYIAAVVIILTLTGIFTIFEGREVVAGTLMLGSTVADVRVTLSQVLLLAVLCGTGYYAAWKVRERGLAAILLNGVAGSLVIGAALALLAVIQVYLTSTLQNLFLIDIDLTFVFPEFGPLVGSTVLFGLELGPGVAILLAASALLGLIGALSVRVSSHLRQTLLTSVALVVVMGLLQSQISSFITLPHALAIALAFAVSYAGCWFVVTQATSDTSVALPILGSVRIDTLKRIAIGAIVGVVATLVFANQFPSLATFANVSLLISIAVLGALATSAARSTHNAAFYLVTILLLLGIVNQRRRMDVEAALVIFFVSALSFWAAPLYGGRADASFARLDRNDQRTVRRLAALVAVFLLLVAPSFVGLYVTGVLDRVGLYIIMGIGLNVVVGYAGLLDLGYVAFFAIGAYTTGLITAPGILTCGVPAGDITPETTCQVLSFWTAWPIAMAVSALAGVLLGIPVLRLRGDYLAIVTLGFGEIINRITLADDFKDVLGGAQGISRVGIPVVDLSWLNPAWRFELNNANGIYYLAVFGVLLAALVTSRLASARLGRAWRAMRADEDVAQAMGINLVRAKLLAFAIGAAFAGMGGAVYATFLFGVRPNDYTLLVSINVLSLIIIGGLGSNLGVVVGALMLIGLPELLRELQDYRLLAFGSLLVLSMLLKPQGLLPPSVRRLSEDAAEMQPQKTAGEVS